MENFIDQIRGISRRIQNVKSNISTEEATKTSLIMPFFQVLGYDVFNPEEFLPEYVADVGIKKGEKVDYAILQNGKPIILVEAKAINEQLEKHDSQLFRYFGTTTAKFAILTNGLVYRFYTDLDEQNKMDAAPFFEFNLSDIRDTQIIELAKFRKGGFDVENILTTASELKYTGEIKQFLSKQWDNPSDDFISFIIADIYPGKKTRNVIEKFTPVVKKSLKQFINDLVSDKLKAALNDSEAEPAVSTDSKNEIQEGKLESETENTPIIVTTEEELEGYVTVKLLLKETVEPERVFYRDNQSYFNVLLDDSIRKWVCRLGLNSKNKYIQFNDEHRTVVNIDQVSDLMNYKDKLLAVAKSFL
ncbi:type I restriction endonuclease [Calidifontibacillus oryziterrae]|uniref:type I restriction endonuclease n=1 Tax=Calidifontibacillus oryziterrae TaxID=1191699 RepID=UPI000312AF66|nr:type I restriction endonuclease [Calidifontibacillus oryziterrae]